MMESRLRRLQLPEFKVKIGLEMMHLLTVELLGLFAVRNFRPLWKTPRVPVY